MLRTGAPAYGLAVHDSVTIHMDAPPDVVWALIPGRSFAFAMLIGGEALNVWRYELELAGDGVEVTESFALTPTAPLRLYWLVAGWARNRTNVKGMRQTLSGSKAPPRYRPTPRARRRDSAGSPRRAL